MVEIPIISSKKLEVLYQKQFLQRKSEASNIPKDVLAFLSD